MPDAATSGSAPIRFGVFEVDLRAEELRKNGAKVRLEGQPIQILGLLLEHPGQVVTREELKQKLWPADTFVDFEHSINAAVKRLREALNDSAETPRFIETLPRRGYRFIYPINGGAGELHGESVWAQAPGAAPSSRRQGHPSWLIATAAGLVLLAGLIGFSMRRWGRTSSIPPIHSLAVLPLENLTGDANEDYFVDGLHDELVTRVAQVSALKVISRTSVLRYKKPGKSLPEIARDLDVDAVIEGSVTRVNGRVHVSAQLIAARTDQHLWAQSYERDDREIQQVPGEIAGAVLNALNVRTSPEERSRVSANQAVDPEVYKLCLKGNYHLRNWKPESQEKALEYFRQALDLDPTYAPAWAGIGQVYLGPAVRSPVDDERAKAALLKAVELDDSLSKAHRLLGRMYLNDGDWANSEKHYLRAMELDPTWYGPNPYFVNTGKLDEAIRAIQHDVSRDPLGFNVNLVLAWTYHMARRYDDAIVQLKRTQELDPHNRLPHYQLAWNYTMKGMYKEAVAECDANTQPEPEVTSGDDCGWVYARAGLREKALGQMQRTREAAKKRGDDLPLGQFAQISDALGDREAAIRFLYEQYRKKGHIIRLNMSHRFSTALQADPRYQELARLNPTHPALPALLARVNTPAAQ